MIRINQITFISVIQFLECIGLFGKECANECNNGYYGHGCRYNCNCTEHFQICNSKYGCIQSGATSNGEPIKFAKKSSAFLLIVNISLTPIPVL